MRAASTNSQAAKISAWAPAWPQSEHSHGNNLGKRLKGKRKLKRPPKTWVALPFSILALGLGHIDAGKARRGLCLLILAPGVMLAGAIIVILALPCHLGLITSLFLMHGVLVLGIVDAVRIARQGRTL
jgi:hypothetical protein